LTTISKTNVFVVALDMPGERPTKYILGNKPEKELRAEAIDLARKHLLSAGVVTVYDNDGKMIYRHAQPIRRQNAN
jgi:hypothetical protein